MSTAGKITAILNPGRMLADGIPYPDYAAALEMLDADGDWFDFWMGISRRYEELGTGARDAGNDVSAGEWLWHASLSAHYAQFMWFHDPERREAGQHAKVALYRDAAPLMAPAAERLDLPFEDTSIPAYLRRPDVDGPVPCVVLIGGLESTKEESYLFEAMCLRRGMATLAFDGPGQGEMFFTRKLGPGFEKVTSTVVDHLEKTDGVDADRIGVLGRSLGAYYSVLSASCDPRLRALRGLGRLLRPLRPRHHAAAHARRLHLRHRHRGPRRGYGAPPRVNRLVRSHRRPALPDLRRARLPRPDLHHAPGRAPARAGHERADRDRRRDGRRPLLPQHGPDRAPAHGGLDGPTPRRGTRAVKPAAFDYAAPTSLDEALQLLAANDTAKVLAGGQSLIPLLNLRLAEPELLVDLRRVPGLNEIARQGDELVIGATVRQRQAERDPLVAEAAPLITAALAEVGHPQIRSRGTVGGSIAHADPAAELPAALVALDGRVIARGPGGERSIAAADFYLGFLTTALDDDEILVAVALPLAPPRTGAACVEIAQRAGDYAACGAVAQVTLDDAGTIAHARVALIGATDRPVRAAAVEEALAGGASIADAARHAGDGVEPIDDPRVPSAYRIHLAGVVTRRALEQARSRAA